MKKLSNENQMILMGFMFGFLAGFGTLALIIKL